jgi:hypothetical protein
MNDSIYSIHAPIVGARLWVLAQAWSRDLPDTQAKREAAIKAVRGRKQVIAGSRSVRIAREAVEAAAAAIRSARKARPYRRATAHLGYAPTVANCPPAQWQLAAGDPTTKREPTHGTPRPTAQRVLLPAGSLEERLERCTARLLRRASPMREGAAGGTTYSVVLTRNPASVRYGVSIGVNRDTYRGAYKGWAAREDHHSITVPHGWLVRVHKRGLAVVDGMLTLDAAPLDHAPDGVRLYAAVWAEQGRGYEVHNRRGVIALAVDGTAYHGADVDQAVRGLARKLTGRRLSAEWAALAAASIDRFRAAVAPFGDVLVRVADARAIGACEYGIRSWCHQVGLDYEAGAATLAQVLAGYELHSAPEARAAIIHALRRVRRSPVALAA